MGCRGMRKGVFSGSGLKTLLRGEPGARYVTACFSPARGVLRRGGNLPRPGLPPLGETEKGEHLAARSGQDGPLERAGAGLRGDQ